MLSAFAVLIIVLAIALLYIGAKLLWKGSWLLGFLRGMLGFSLLLASGLAVLLALEIFSFERWEAEKPVATLSFEQVGDQVYKATFVIPEQGVEKSFEINGDQWQLDARIIRWKDWASALGAEPGYQLDRLSGRYYSLEDERTKKRAVHTVGEEHHTVDIWSWLHEHRDLVPIIEAKYGSATYLPMVDGALFQVRLSSSGLTARAMNPVAEQAIEYWQ